MPKKNKSFKVKLIANPGAGDPSKINQKIEQVVQYLLDAGFKVNVALAHPKKKAISIARKAVKNGYDIVIAMGGDGTIGAVIHGIAGLKTRLGIIPAGTENDIARSLDIPENLNEACAIIADGHTRKIDLGQIKVKGVKKFYFPMVVTVELTATIYPEIKEVPEGKLSGIKDAVGTLLKFDTKPTVYLTLDNESKIKVESMLVTIANTPLIGAKNRVAPDASMEDGLLDIATYPDFNKAELLSYFAKTANEGVTADGKIQRYQARKIKIKTSPKLDIAAEGIVLGKGTARIKVLPGALRVLAPTPGSGVEKPMEKAGESLPEPLSSISP